MTICSIFINLKIRWVSNERSDWSAWLGNHDDVEARLSDFNARLYDPYLGRFLAVDELWSEQPGWNPYHYGMNNPIIYSDPTGYEPYFTDYYESNNSQYYDMILDDWSFFSGATFNVGADGMVTWEGGRENSQLLKSLSLSIKSKGGNDVMYRIGYEMGSKSIRSPLIKPDQNYININPDEINNFITSISNQNVGLNPITLGFGMVAFHEYIHNIYKHAFGDRPATKEKPAGPVAFIVNKVRSEMGQSFGQRVLYTSGTYAGILNGWGLWGETGAYTTFEYNGQKINVCGSFE